MKNITADNSETVNLKQPERSLKQIRGEVAGVLLGTAGDETGRIRLLTLREMASSLDTTPDVVNKSLEYLQTKGAVRLERQRVVLDKELLEKIAGSVNNHN